MRFFPSGSHRHGSRRLLTIVGIAAAGVLVFSMPAVAETSHVVALAPTIDDVLGNIRNWIMGILALLATVFLTIGGVRYVIANGDPGEIQKAKQAFLSAAFGYGLAMLAPLMVEILKGIVEA